MCVSETCINQKSFDCHACFYFFTLFSEIQAIVFLALLWHFDILNTNLSPNLNGTKKTCVAKRNWKVCDVSQSFHCLSDGLLWLSSSGGDERDELLQLLSANVCFYVHDQSRHWSVYDPHCPWGSLGLQRPSPLKDPHLAAWCGRIFWSDVEGRHGYIHEGVFLEASLRFLMLTMSNLFVVVWGN